MEMSTSDSNLRPSSSHPCCAVLLSRQSSGGKITSQEGGAESSDTHLQSLSLWGNLGDFVVDLVDQLTVSLAE